MAEIVQAELLTRESFAAFGDVLERGTGKPEQDFPIYQYWDKFANLDFSGDPADLAFLTVYRRAFILDEMERHEKASQAFIPLTSNTCIFALAPPGQGDHPDPESIRAFILDGTKGVNLHRGTWHWSIFPINESADFIMLVRRDTVVDDLHIVELDTPVELRL